MQQGVNGQKTMYIKFPTVTKLQYPLGNNQDHPAFRSTSYRSNLLRQTSVKMDIITMAKTESFKIIHLPEKNEIMNICSMPVREKAREQQKQCSSGEKPVRKKIFSVCKLNTMRLAAQTEYSSFKNPLHLRRANSNQQIKKLTLAPPPQLDYADAHTHIAKLIALSFGLAVANEEGSRIRRGRVDGGNNGLLVRQTLKKRIWWNVVGEEKREGEVGINLIWTQQILSKRNIDRLIENNQKCMREQNGRYEEQRGSFSRSFDKVMAQLPRMQQLFFTEWQQPPRRLKDWLFQLGQSPQRVIYPEGLLITNHLPNNWQITNKKLLYSNMVAYYEQIGINPHNKVPKTYLLSCFNWQEAVKDIRGDHCQWILKPGEFTNRGRGITVFRTTKEAIDHVLNHPPTTEDRSYLLQEYITPMLYEERKFDIRCYMLGVEIGGCLKFYWYEEGYIRTASEKFSLKKVAKSIHLTNDAVQKNMKNYGEHESANKLSYHDIDKYCLNHTTFNFYQEILPEIKRITRDICHAVGDSRLIGAGAGFSFEVFGLDFLVDQHGKPWLCEVNTNPSLEICCSLLSRIIPELLENTCRLLCDIFLPPKKPPEFAQHFLLNNKFALIYSNARVGAQ